MTRVYRASLKLFNQLEARPLRQPFLDYAKDDDIVASYIGYDNVADLNKFRLLPFLVSAVAVDFTIRYRPDELLPALQLLFETRETCCYEEAVLYHDDDAAVLHQRGKLSDAGRFYAARLAWWPVYFSRSALHKMLLDRDHCKKTNPRYWEKHQDILGKLPEIDPDSVKIPELMEHEEDIEGCVRMAMLAESIKELLKPSVWGRKFPDLVIAATSASFKTAKSQAEAQSVLSVPLLGTIGWRQDLKNATIEESLNVLPRDMRDEVIQHWSRKLFLPADNPVTKSLCANIATVDDAHESEKDDPELDSGSDDWGDIVSESCLPVTPYQGLGKRRRASL